jgi:integrase
MASITKQPNGRYKVRFRTPDGRERARRFDRKGDADRFANAVETDKVRGEFIDPRAGRSLFADFAGGWLAAQTFDESTREAVASRLRLHVLPTFGQLELRSIRPSTVQAWLRGRQQECAPRYVRVMFANVSAIFGAAVEDGLIARNPCAAKSVQKAKVNPDKVEPWPHERVEAVIAAHPDRYRAVPIVAAGCGLRQGEVFGLRRGDVAFLERKLRVRQQIKILGGKLVTAPPKGGKTRDVPLPDIVSEALAEHLRKYPVADEDELIFLTRERKPLNRNYFNPHIWKPAVVAAGVEPTRANGMHALRHYYASVLLHAGESIRALADYLGHADPGFTLRTYTHLMPESHERTRAAVDAAFGSRKNPAARVRDVSNDAR